MRRFYCFTLGFFLLTVRAGKEDFQGHHTEQTKDTTVTKDLLLKKTITIGHGTDAISTESTQQHTAASAKAERPEVDLFDNRPAPSFERTPIPKAWGVIALMSDFISPTEQNPLKSTGDNSSAVRIHTKSGTSLISNYDEIVFPSTQAAFQSMTNASEPEASPSADAVNALFWLHNLLENGNQRNTVSPALTSADRGQGVPGLSASRPRVIDYPTALRNDSDDNRSRGTDEKRILNLGRNEHPVQSIFPSHSAKDSTSGSTATNLCLICQKDRREVSAEKSMALPPPSPDGTSASLSIERLALDLSEFTTSLHQQSVGEGGEMLNDDKRQQSVTKHSPSGVREQLVNSMSFPPLSLNETVNHSNSQINYFLSGTETFNTLVELSSAAQDTEEQSHHTFASGAFVTGRPIPAITALYRSSELLYTGRNQETLGEKVSTEEPHSKLIYISQHNKDASHGPSANFKNTLVQNQSLDVSDSSDVADPPPCGGDHSAASHPTARMGLIEAHSSPASFSLSRATTSAVKDPESHSLTGGAGSLISVSRSPTPTKADANTQRPILTSDIQLTSVTTKRRLTDELDSLMSNTVNSIVKQVFVDPSGPARKPVIKEAQTPTVTMRKVVPVTLLLSESRRDLEDDASLSSPTPPSKSLSESPTISRLLVSQSEINQVFEVSNDNVATTLRSVVKYSRDINRDSLIDEDNTMNPEGRPGQVVKETEEALKLQEEEESREDEKVGSEREELFRSDTTESGKQEKIMNTGVEINHTTDHEEDRLEEHEAKTRGEEVGGTTRQEDVTLREDKGPRQVEVREEGDAEEQRASSTKEGAESKGDITFNGELRREDMTNVPFGTITNSAELNRDKGHTTTNLSPCHALIKQFGAPEHEGICLGGNAAHIVEMKNKPFSYEVTSIHRPLHSTLRIQRPNLLSMTSLPEEPRTQIKPHPSTNGAALPKHAATKGSTQNRVVKVMFLTKTGPTHSRAFGDSTPKFSDTLKPTISTHSRATESAHPELKSPSKTLSLTTPALAIQVEFLGAQQHFAVNTRSVSIIYSTSDRRQTLSTPDSQEISQTTNKREQAEHILPTSRFDASVREPLTSDTSEEVNQSTRVKAAPTQQMDNDSSPRPTTATALSSVAHTSTGRQSAPERSQSTASSSDMSPGQPCSFKLSEHTAHSDALHAAVDDNEQRSVQTLMTLMSPKAKNDQFPLSGMSALPNLMLFEDDSLPGTYSLTGLTRSASEKEILRASADAEHANSGSGRAVSLLGTAEVGNQTEANGGAQKTTTSRVKHSYGGAKQMAESKDESSPFGEQTSGRREQHASNTEGFSSLSSSHTQTLAGGTNEGNALFNVEGSDDANNTVKTALESHLSQLRAHTETSTIQSTLQIEQAIREEVVPATNDFAVSVLDMNDQTFVESESLPETPQMQSNDVTNNAFSHTESHTATTERRRDPSTPPGAPTAPRIHSGSDLKLHHTFTQQIAVRIMDVTSDFPITTETNDSVSPAPAASVGVLIVSTDARESQATTNESQRVVVAKSTRAAQAKRMVQSAGRIELSSLRESPTTASTDKLTPAVKRPNTTETRSGEQPEREISAQAIEQNQHAPPDTTTATHPISDPGPSLLKAAQGAREAHDTTPTRVKRVGHLPKVDGAAQHEEQASHEKIPVGHVILGTVTDSAPPTGISPADISDKTSSRTIGCVESGEGTTGAAGIDHNTRERMYRTQAGITGGDHFDEVHRSTDRPVPEKATPQATNLDCAALSSAAGKSDCDLATVEDTAGKNAKSVTGETSTRTRTGLVETDHLEGRKEPEPPQFVEKTTQRPSHRLTSGPFAAEVTVSEPEASTVQSTVKTGEQAEKNIKIQLNRGAAKAAQKASRSARSVAEGETAGGESGRTLLLLEPESEQRRRRSSPHLFLSGITAVSDDLCGSGNYTAEMSVTLGRGVEPGDAVPALANLRVVINLKTNSSGMNLKVTSCCLSPSIRPDPTNSTCCLISRLAAAPAGITPLPSGLSSRVSFTISLFQMINYSVVYLHCDLRVCPRNRSNCERRCLQQRNAFPSEGREAIVTNLRNRISFGPMLKEVRNSTFPEKMELDLVLVLVSLLAGSSLVTVTLLLVWLAYRRRAIWLLYSAAPPRACCGCLHPGGDLIPP